MITFLTSAVDCLAASLTQAECNACRPTRYWNTGTSTCDSKPAFNTVLKYSHLAFCFYLIL